MRISPSLHFLTLQILLLRDLQSYSWEGQAQNCEANLNIVVTGIYQLELLVSSIVGKLGWEKSEFMMLILSTSSCHVHMVTTRLE